MTHAAHHALTSHDQAEILDLDAEVLAEHTRDITAWLPVKNDLHHIVDLGSGTGAGTFALLAQFPNAKVTAVDASEPHLQRLKAKAEELGLTDRVHTVLTDLNAPWPTLDTPDLVWASASLHHMTNPDDTLRQVHDLLPPDGLFAVVELSGFPRFLPANAPEQRPGLEDRCHNARPHHDHLPHRGADWGQKLTAADFTVEGERTITAKIDGTQNPTVGHYALTTLKRLRHNASQFLATEDLAALDELLDTDGPHSILRREDLAVRTERTVWVARRA